MFTPKEQAQFSSLLQKHTGIQLTKNKINHLETDIRRVISNYNISTINQLIELLSRTPTKKLITELTELVTVHETKWFRDGSPFKLLIHDILPAFAQMHNRCLRIWSAGCSSGQEAYSIAIAVEEYLSLYPRTLESGVEIIGTDISPSILKIARRGEYTESSILQGVTSTQRKKFFHRTKGVTWKLNQNILNRVQFRSLNLQDDFRSLGKFDVILCRNVLIYFQTSYKRSILNNFASSLNPKGWLFAGVAENILNDTDDFQMMQMASGTVYRKKS